MTLRLMHFGSKRRSSLRDHNALQHSPEPPRSSRSPYTQQQFLFGTDIMSRKRNSIDSKSPAKNDKVKQKGKVKKPLCDGLQVRIVLWTCCPIVLCLIAYEFKFILYSGEESNDLKTVGESDTNGGWRVADMQTVHKYDSNICTVDRRRSDDLTTGEFEKEYRYKKPVIVTFNNGAADWTDPKKWSVANLKKEYGDWLVFSGNSRDIVRKGGSGYVSSSFSNYVDKLMSETDVIGEPFYVFDRAFYNDSSLPSTLKPPKYFAIKDGVDDSIFFLGSSVSGVSFHKHADAWNGVVYGRKRWFLYPSEKTPPGGVYPGYTQREWVEQIYPTLPDEDKPMECIQEPGEILYLPEGTYHATVNIGDTIAIGIQKKRASTATEKLFYEEYDLVKKIRTERNEGKKKKLMKRKQDLFKTLLDLLPHNAEVHMKCSGVYADMGRHDKAITHLQTAIALDKHFTIAVLNLAKMYIQTGNLDEADALYKHAVAMSPNLWDVYAQYGDFLVNNGRPLDAIRMYRKGTELQPEGIEFWKRLKVAHERSGDSDAAKVIQTTINKLVQAQAQQRK